MQVSSRANVIDNVSFRRCKQWVELCQNDKVIQKFKNHGSSQVSKSFRICSEHFKREDYVLWTSKKKWVFFFSYLFNILLMLYFRQGTAQRIHSDGTIDKSQKYTYRHGHLERDEYVFNRRLFINLSFIYLLNFFRF